MLTWSNCCYKTLKMLYLPQTFAVIFQCRRALPTQHIWRPSTLNWVCSINIFTVIFLLRNLRFFYCWYFVEFLSFTSHWYWCNLICTSIVLNYTFEIDAGRRKSGLPPRMRIMGSSQGKLELPRQGLKVCTDTKLRLLVLCHCIMSQK